MNKSKEVKITKVENFKLPRYLRLAKGSMFFDTEGENASGIKLYAVNEVFIGREIQFTETKNSVGFQDIKVTEVPQDRNHNKDISDFGKVESILPWYVDINNIDPNKLSRIITAYKYGILIEADITTPPVQNKVQEVSREFKIADNGDRVFVGKNKEMFKKLQNMNFKNLREFINSFPTTISARDNLMDLYSYELRGYNPLNRSRLEVIDLLKKKLKEFGPSISSIRINED